MGMSFSRSFSLYEMKKLFFTYKETVENVCSKESTNDDLRRTKVILFQHVSSPPLRRIACKV